MCISSFCLSNAKQPSIPNAISRAKGSSLAIIGFAGVVYKGLAGCILLGLRRHSIAMSPESCCVSEFFLRRTHRCTNGIDLDGTMKMDAAKRRFEILTQQQSPVDRRE